MNLDEKLAERFDLDVPEVVPAPLPAVIPPPPVPAVVETSTLQDIDTDTAKARTTINSLIDKSMSALDELIRVAKAGESARDYEVVGQLLKATADMSKDLLTIQKVRKELRPTDDDEGPKKTTIGTQQNIFVGSTNDLMRALTAAGISTGRPPLEIVNAEVQPG